MQRGVRQGCSLSPLLFNVFINDFPRALGRGVRVPGLPQPVAALMFADDVVGLANSTKSAKTEMLEGAEKWANLHRCTFGISKCGVMMVNGCTTQEALVTANLKLQGQVLPVVDSYTYLGFSSFRSLDLFSSVQVRVAKGKRLAAATSAFFQNRSIPLAAKIDVLRMVMVPTLAFGGEIYGMHATLCRPLESILSKLLRSLLYGWGRPSATLLRSELGIHSVHASMSSMRARAVSKYPLLRTWIADLVRNPVSQRTATWVSGAQRWLRRLRVPAGDVKEFLAAKELAGDKSLGAVSYRSSGFVETRSYVQYYLSHRRGTDPFMDAGLAGLVAARTGGLMLAPQAASAGLADARFRRECPCCGAHVKEPLRHLLLFCTAWSECRASFLSPLLDLFPAVTSSAKVCLLLGGTACGWSLGARWATSVKRARPLFLNVAAFFASIKRRRAIFLWGSTGPGADAHPG